MWRSKQNYCHKSSCLLCQQTHSIKAIPLKCSQHFSTQKIIQQKDYKMCLPNQSADKIAINPFLEEKKKSNRKEWKDWVWKMGFNSLKWFECFCPDIYSYKHTHTFNLVNAVAAILRTLKQYVHRFAGMKKKDSISSNNHLVWSINDKMSLVSNVFLGRFFFPQKNLLFVVTRSIWTDVRKSNCSITLTSLCVESFCSHWVW